MSEQTPQEPKVESDKPAKVGELVIEHASATVEHGDISKLVKPIPKPTHTARGQEIVYYVEEGIEKRRYTESGVIQRWSDKANKWVFAKGTSSPGQITVDNAAALAHRKWDKLEEAAAEGIIEATGEKTAYGAIKRMSAAAASHGMAGGKGGATYWEKAIKAAGWARDKRGSGEELPPGTVKLTLIAPIRSLRGDMAQQYRQDVTPEDGE